MVKQTDSARSRKLLLSLLRISKRRGEILLRKNAMAVFREEGLRDYHLNNAVSAMRVVMRGGALIDTDDTPKEVRTTLGRPRGHRRDDAKQWIEHNYPLDLQSLLKAGEAAGHTRANLYAALEELDVWIDRIDNY